MAGSFDLPDDDLPDLRTILFPCPTQPTTKISIDQPYLRRSPRKQQKHAAVDVRYQAVDPPETCVLKATSNQRRMSPTKTSPTKQPIGRAGREQNGKTGGLFSEIPVLPKKAARNALQQTSGNGQGLGLTHVDSLLLPLSKMVLAKGEINSSDSEPAFVFGKARPRTRKRSSSGKSIMRLMTEAARNPPPRIGLGNDEAPAKVPRRNASAARKYVLGEAVCLQDVAESDANDEGEDEETDLSGFIVDDDAELSYHESAASESEVASEPERQPRQRATRVQPTQAKPRRRLQRGRRVVHSEDEGDDGGDSLTDVFRNLKIGTDKKEHAQTNVEIQTVDLVSPEPGTVSKVFGSDKVIAPVRTNLFDTLQALRLSPPREKASIKVPSHCEDMAAVPIPQTRKDATIEIETNRPTTPTQTPPRSPTKLKSPSKLLSPSKRKELAPRSPHRQSMDTFWDLNAVNEWNDQYSPRKAPLASPRKMMKHFNLWSDSDDDGDSAQRLEESSDDLPSPCESPSKTQSLTSPVKNLLKAEKLKALEAKKAKVAQKKEFDAQKDCMAKELLDLLDTHITNGQISRMAASTGGVNVIWSKTLRSTAGRANWKKTRSTKSPIKPRISEGPEPEETVRHFANIELAIKIIDRPERLYDTLAHEFCHLANFMVSGIIDQPHGTQFQAWAAKTTRWMRDQSGRSEWEKIKITTKHGYVIEHKYLWACTGRAKSMATKIPNLDDDDDVEAEEGEEGCGAEYGRHSKSIDTDKHRCGVCKGVLVQVRPKPRASPRKESRSLVKKRNESTKLQMKDDAQVVVKEIEIIELSD